MEYDMEVPKNFKIDAWGNWPPFSSDSIDDGAAF